MLNELLKRYPCLEITREDIIKAENALITAFKNGNKLLICGNGGSCANCEHIVGELMKGFLKRRPLNEKMRRMVAVADPENADFLADNLQYGLPAISLHSQSALLTAFANDVDASMMFAQTLFALGKPGDTLVAISTSGNSANVVNAAKIAKSIGVHVIGLTGEKNCLLDKYSDCVIHVGAIETYRVQELHLPVYHWLCAKVEDEFFAE